MTNFPAAVALPLLFIFPCPAHGKEDANTWIARYLKSVQQIQSYDVTLRVGYLAYPNAMRLDAPGDTVQENIVDYVRDAMAVGVGRRVERSIGNLAVRNISVIDWKSASMGQSPVEAGLITGWGTNYFDAFNPGVRGFFLADLFQSKQTTVHTLDVTGPLIGLEASNPSIQGSVRVYLDPNHGYLPARIDQLTLKNGNLYPYMTIRIGDWLQTGDACWAPLSGTITLLIPQGQAAGRPFTGFSMKVVREKSSWNSIHSDALFRSESLPKVNHEDRGWKQYFPPLALTVARHEDSREMSFEIINFVVVLVRNSGPGLFVLIL